MSRKSHHVAMSGFLLTAAIVGFNLVAQGCGNTGGAKIICLPETDPKVFTFCPGKEDAGTDGADAETADAETSDAETTDATMAASTCTGQCLPAGPSGFQHIPILLWMGSENEEPECPERANGVFFQGYYGLTVDFPCQECSCGPAECTMPSGLVATSGSACQGGKAVPYDGPAEWDGSCVAPGQLPVGSFRSIELSPATVSPCKPIGNAEPPKPPAFAPQTSSFVNGIYWKSRAKACQGSGDGKCSISDYQCVPDIRPAPPEFRYCLEYNKTVDETNLPECPGNYPDRFLFHKGVSGKPECSPCECGEVSGAECSVSFSAYQDATCSGTPMPLFKDLTVKSGTCVDFDTPSVSLGSMSATWTAKQAGQCEPKGGNMVNDVKPQDPHVFCCQPLAPSTKASQE